MWILELMVPMLTSSILARFIQTSWVFIGESAMAIACPELVGPHINISRENFVVWLRNFCRRTLMGSSIDGTFAGYHWVIGHVFQSIVAIRVAFATACFGAEHVTRWNATLFGAAGVGNRFGQGLCQWFCMVVKEAVGAEIAKLICSRNFVGKRFRYFGSVK